MPLGVEIPPSPEKRGTKGYLDQLKESMVENSKKIFDWFKTLFTKSKEKGLKETLMGSFLGFLSIFDRPTEGGKPEPQKPPEVPFAAETQAQLEQLQASLPALFDHTQIESQPYEVSDTTGVTLCSGTALKNLRKMGGFRDDEFFSAKQAVEKLTKNPDMAIVGIPSGNAIDVRNFYIKSKHHEKITGSTTNDAIAGQLDSSGKNLADILVDSTSPWEHRAVAFKSAKDRHWYILDPYRTGQSTKPLPIEQYQGKIMFAIPLNANKALSVPISPDTAPLMAGNRAVKAAGEVLTEPAKGENCWEWVERIYQRARLGRKTIFDNHKTHQEKNFATPEVLSKIQPGDHLYIHNQNAQDTYGDHSVIFFGWEGSPSEMKARVASSWNQAKAPTVEVKNLNPSLYKPGNKSQSSTPVTYIAHPV